MAKKNKMGACMSEWKDKHPEGRANKKMGKEAAHKQAIAACLSKTNEGLNLTFGDFLREMEQMDVRSVIRAMPMYQELVKNPQTKPDALRLAKSFVDEFGQQSMTPQISAYIQDEFDDMYRRTAGKHGMNVGDWKGEEEYHRRRQEEKDIESAADKWERATGMDAETGQDSRKYDQRGRLRHGARSGLDFMNKVKQKRAAQDLLSLGNVKDDDDRERLQRKATMDAPGEDTWNPEMGGPTDINPRTKVNRSKEIGEQELGGLEQGQPIPKEVRKRLMDRLMSELDMSKNGATTYYYRLKKQFGL